MSTLTEARIQHFIDHAQHTLHLHDHYRHERDHSYREVMSLVEELVDLMLELRRERAALQRIASLADDLDLAADPEVGAQLAARMRAIAREALGLPIEIGETPAL